MTLKFLTISATLFLADILFDGVEFNSLAAFLLSSAFFFSFDVFIKPVLKFLTLPIHVLSLGLSSFIINVLVVYALSLLLPDFKLHSFLWALPLAALVSFASSLADKLD